VNLEVLQRDGAVPDPLTVVQVWFAHDDPVLLGRVTRALHARGMSVTDTARVSQARRTLDRSVAAWSLALASLVGLAALLLAVLALVVMAASTWAARARDLASLRMSGLSRAQISRVAAGEQVPIVALAVLFGGVCGVVGAHFAMPTVPLFASATQVSSADLGTAWAAALGAAGVALLLLCGTGWATASFLARCAVLARVRESL
jgi:predicted lysophospholipase L1 biosynthesis ABC-type transport system permease subunit